MVFNEQHLFAFRIHYILLNEMKIVVQSSVESKIKVKFQSIELFFENNLNPTELNNIQSKLIPSNPKETQLKINHILS